MYCWMAFKLSCSSGAALATGFGNLLMLNQHSYFRRQLHYMVSLCQAAVVLCTSDCSVQRVLLLWFRKHLQVEPHWAPVLLRTLWKQFSFEVKGLAVAQWRPWWQVGACAAFAWPRAEPIHRRMTSSPLSLARFPQDFCWMFCHVICNPWK